jgi:hypothetical protein
MSYNTAETRRTLFVSSSFFPAVRYTWPRTQYQTKTMFPAELCIVKYTQQYGTELIHKVCSAVPNGSATNSQGIRGCLSLTATLKFIYSLIKGKAVPLQAWGGPDGSTKLKFPDFLTTAQDSGKVVSLTHRPPLPQGNSRSTHFC